MKSPAILNGLVRLARELGREDRQLARGKTYEPPTFVDRQNWAT